MNTPESDGPRLDAERYRFILEHVGEMITAHRPGDWAYTALNPLTTQLSGFAPEEMLGKPAYDFLHPEDAEAMKKKMIPAIYRHGIRTFRYRALNKNGSYYWVESTHRSIRDEHTGELKEIIAVTRDITAQITAEQANRRLAAVVEASFDMIIFCTRRGRVTYMNTVAMQKLGFAKRREACCDLKELLSVESRQRLKTLVFQIAEAEGSWRGSLRLQSPRAPDRYWVLEQVFAQPQETQCGREDYFSLIIRDLTEQKKAELDIRDRQAELAHASRLMMLGEMASGLAHEINQPLATTLNYARGTVRQLDQGNCPSPDTLRQVFDTIIKQAQRAADIVKRLRCMVKKAPYQRSRFTLDDVCREVAGFIQRELTEQNIELVFVNHQAPVTLEADRVQIEQVLINLLRNAAEAYRGSGKRDKRIIVEVAPRGAEVIVRVTDFAQGIAAEAMPHIFEPYYTSKEDGLGLGLSISRSIVEAHSGRIIATSDDTGGTTFEITLPLTGKQQRQA